VWKCGKLFRSTTSVPDFATVIFNTATATRIIIIHLPPDFFGLYDCCLRRRLVRLYVGHELYLHVISFIMSMRLLFSSTRHCSTNMFRRHSAQSVHCTKRVFVELHRDSFFFWQFTYRVCQADVPRLRIQMTSARCDVVDYSKHVGTEV
jgi:hypothetical protein